jgi:hypothetical protein
VNPKPNQRVGIPSRWVTLVAAGVVLTGSVALFLAALKSNAGETGPGVISVFPAVWIALSLIVILSMMAGLPGFAVAASLLCLPVGLYLVGANNALRLVGAAVFVMFFAAVANWIARHQTKLEKWRRDIR